MARGQQNFLDLIVKAQCCAADMAYKALKQEMFLKADRVIAFKNVRYIQALLGIMNRYYDTVYCLQDEPCLSDEEIEVVIEKILELCDLCGCCTEPYADIPSSN
jgi:hypothetical protein